MGYLKAMALYQLPVNSSYSILDKNISSLFEESLDKAVKEIEKIPMPTALLLQ